MTKQFSQIQNLKMEFRKSIMNAPLTLNSLSPRRTQSPEKRILLSQRYNDQQLQITSQLPMEIEKNYKVPDLIRKLYPKLKNKKYFDYCENPGFLEQELLVCKECFALIDRGVNVKEDVEKMAQQEKIFQKQFYGIEKLNPEFTSQRFIQTRKSIIESSEPVKKQQFSISKKTKQFIMKDCLLIPVLKSQKGVKEQISGNTVYSESILKISEDKVKPLELHCNFEYKINTSTQIHLLADNSKHSRIHVKAAITIQSQKNNYDIHYILLYILLCLSTPLIVSVSLQVFKLIQIYYQLDNQSLSSRQQELYRNIFEHDINLEYSRDSHKFLGTWENQIYQVIRKYIPTKQKTIELYFTEFIPSDRSIMGAVLIVHGFGEHQGRYIHLADLFARNGYKVYLYDQRGFGYSGGVRGHSSIEEMHQDLEVALSHIGRSLPIFIYAHSLGAAVVFSFLLINPSINLQGIISTNAYLRIPKQITFSKKLLLKFLNYFFPDIVLNSYINLSHCSKNNFHIKKMASDPLLWPFLSVRMAYNIFKLGEYILPNAHKIKCPILLLHGKENKVSPHMNSIDFYRLSNSKEKTLKLFEQGYHEMIHDIEWDKIKPLLIAWCNKICMKDRRIANLRQLNYGLGDQMQNDNIIFKRRIAKAFIFGFFFVLRDKFRCLNLFGKVAIISILQSLVHLLIKEKNQ